MEEQQRTLVAGDCTVLIDADGRPGFSRLMVVDGAGRVKIRAVVEDHLVDDFDGDGMALRLLAERMNKRFW